VQVRGLIARRRSGLLDLLSAARPWDLGALPGRGRTRPAANVILGWLKASISEARLRRTGSPGRARFVQLKRIC